MTDPFHHKHPYLTVIVLLIILLVVSEFFSSLFSPRHDFGHHYDHHYSHYYDRDYGHRWHNFTTRFSDDGIPRHMKRFCGDDMQVWIETRLFLGLGDDNSKTVSDAEWAQFVQEVIHLRLPLGFTVVDASGYWGDASGAFHTEETQILILLYDGSKDEVLDEIIAAHKARHDQTTVIRTDHHECVVFR